MARPPGCDSGAPTHNSAKAIRAAPFRLSQCKRRNGRHAREAPLARAQIVDQAETGLAEKAGADGDAGKIGRQRRFPGARHHQALAIASRPQPFGQRPVLAPARAACAAGRPPRPCAPPACSREGRAPSRSSAGRSAGTGSAPAAASRPCGRERNRRSTCRARSEWENLVGIGLCRGGSSQKNGSKIPWTMALLALSGSRRRRGASSTSSQSVSPGPTWRRKRAPSRPPNSGSLPAKRSSVSTAMAPTWAIASHISTPGSVGRPGKWPAKNHSSPVRCHGPRPTDPARARRTRRRTGTAGGAAGRRPVRQRHRRRSRRRARGEQVRRRVLRADLVPGLRDLALLVDEERRASMPM